MFGCVLSQLKPSEFYILRCEKGLGLRPPTFFPAKNGELLRLYPIHIPDLTTILPAADPQFPQFSHDPQHDAFTELINRIIKAVTRNTHT